MDFVLLMLLCLAIVLSIYLNAIIGYQKIEIMKLKEAEMHINGQIFMGAGDHSLAQMGYLYSELGRAFEILSGIQQPLMSTDKPIPGEKKMKEDGEYEIQHIAAEIYLGLTGDKVD